MWTAGTTFQGQTHPYDHLFVVATPPAANGNLVIVNFTTRRRYSDSTCVVQAGEHPRITSESVALYERSKVVHKDDFAQMLEDRGMLQREALPQPLLNRVIQGFRDSRHTPGHVGVEIELQYGP